MVNVKDVQLGTTTRKSFAKINEVMKTLTLQQKLDNAIIGNATYLGLTSPTTAQNTAQIRALTRIVNGLLKLRSGNLKDTNGT